MKMFDLNKQVQFEIDDSTDELKRSIGLDRAFPTNGHFDQFRDHVKTMIRNQKRGIEGIDFDLAQDFHQDICGRRLVCELNSLAQWTNMTEASVLVVDEDTLEAMRKNEVLSLSQYAIEHVQCIAKERSESLRFAHKFAESQIAIPSNRDCNCVEGKCVSDSGHFFPRSGFFVKSNVIATVEHGLSDTDLSKLRFVCCARYDHHQRGYNLNQASVYKPQYTDDGAELDICRIEDDLDDILAFSVVPEYEESHSPLPFMPKFDRYPQSGTKVTAIAHPMGLPQMTIGCEQLLVPRDYSSEGSSMLEADLDVFIGCSGSPVVAIDNDNFRIIGMIKGQFAKGEFFAWQDQDTLVFSNWLSCTNEIKPEGLIIPISRILDQVEKYFSEDISNIA